MKRLIIVGLITVTVLGGLAWLVKAMPGGGCVEPNYANKPVTYNIYAFADQGQIVGTCSGYWRRTYQAVNDGNGSLVPYCSQTPEQRVMIVAFIGTATFSYNGNQYTIDLSAVGGQTENHAYQDGVVPENVTMPTAADFLWTVRWEHKNTGTTLIDCYNAPEEVSSELRILNPTTQSRTRYQIKGTNASLWTASIDNPLPPCAQDHLCVDFGTLCNIWTGTKALCREGLGGGQEAADVTIQIWGLMYTDPVTLKCHICWAHIAYCFTYGVKSYKGRSSFDCDDLNRFWHPGENGNGYTTRKIHDDHQTISVSRISFNPQTGDLSVAEFNNRGTDGDSTHEGELPFTDAGASMSFPGWDISSCNPPVNNPTSDCVFYALTPGNCNCSW